MIAANVGVWSLCKRVSAINSLRQKEQDPETCFIDVGALLADCQSVTDSAGDQTLGIDAAEWRWTVALLPEAATHQTASRGPWARALWLCLGCQALPGSSQSWLSARSANLANSRSSSSARDSHSPLAAPDANAICQPLLLLAKLALLTGSGVSVKLGQRGSAAGVSRTRTSADVSM